MNEHERTMWVNNDEGLYQLWKLSRLSLRAFVRKHRTEIDSYITALLDKACP